MYIPLPVGSIATETPENPVQSHKILQTPPKFTSQNPMRSHEQSPSNPAEIHTVIVHLVAEDSLKKETHVSRQRGSWPMAEMPPEMMGKPIGKASKRMEHPREKGGLNGKIIELNGWLFSTSCLIIAGYTKITKAGQTERSSDKMVDINTIRLYIYICAWNRSKH